MARYKVIGDGQFAVHQIAFDNDMVASWLPNYKPRTINVAVFLDNRQLKLDNYGSMSVDIFDGALKWFLAFVAMEKWGHGTGEFAETFESWRFDLVRSGEGR